MFWFDILVALVLVVAVWNGVRRGLIMQLCSLVGIVVGLWLASHLGEDVGELFGVADEYEYLVGFATVMVAALILVTLVGMLLRKFFHFVGFGMLDRILGIVVAVAKYVLVLSALVAVFDHFNAEEKFLPRAKLEGSYTYGPLCELANKMLPLAEEVHEELFDKD